MARGKPKTTKDRNNDKAKKNYHRLFGVVFVMVLFGFIMILSASSVRAFDATGDSYYYVKKQLIAAAIGFGALFFFSRTSLRTLQRFAQPAMIVVIAMLVAVLIPGIGKKAGGASSWIPVAGFQIQPSELAKLALILFTADFLAKRRKYIDDIKELVYPYGAAVLLIILLVMKQPDMGTALTICITVLVILFVGGLNLGYIIGIGSIGSIVATYFIYSAPYRLRRFTAFLNPMADPLGAGYHIRQSLIAFGSGGLFGIGIGMSRQKYFYLPAAHTDFIFAIIGEELGLLGTFFTVSLFVIFAYYGIRISLQSKSYFGRLVGAGVTSMVVLQALVNMGTVIAVLPITGIPMPFISYGGSSLVANLAAVGMLLSITADNKREERTRRRKPDLHVVGDERSTGNKSGNRRKPGKKARLETGRRSSSSASRTKSSRGKSRTASSSAKSSVNRTKKTRKSRVNESNNQRRGNRRSRISGSRTRKSTTKSRRRS